MCIATIKGKAMDQILNNQLGKLDHIDLPAQADPNRKSVIRVADGHRKHGIFEEIADKLNFKGIRVDGLRELVGFLCYHDAPPDLICLDHDMIHEYDLPKLVDSLRTLLQIRFNKSNSKIAIRVVEPLNKAEIKQYKAIGIQGLVPRAGSFNYHLNLKAYDTLLKDEEFWPSDCIIKTHGVSKKSTENSDGIHLTDRQMQVQRLLCERGLSNKAIARQLNISESTVKIHVSAILKRYAVRNRTQLALAAKNQARL